MYEKLTDIEKLDAGLYYFVNSNNPAFSQLSDIKKALQIPNSKLLFELLHKLEKDSFIVMDLNPVDGREDKSKSYRSTFDGRMFYDLGGYRAKFLADAADAEEQRLEIVRLRSVDVSNDQNQRRLNKLTNRLSWATWFAFGSAFLLLI